MIENMDQKQAFEKFSRLKCGALFMSMGTGKTKVALELAQYKFNQSKVDFILYIAPASVIRTGNIENERLKWTPDLPVTYATCEGFGSSDRIYLEILEQVKNHKTFCICDESLFIKNIRAKRTRRIIDIGKYSEYRLVLNGTPLTKNIIDVWSQMEFLSPKILNMTFREYKDTFCEYYVKAKSKRNKNRIKRQMNIPYLISLIEPYIYQAELDIEYSKVFHTENYYVNKYEYEIFKNDIFDKYYDGEDLNFQAFSQKLQSYYTSQNEHLEAIQNLIDKIKDRVIVFVKYLSNIPDNAECITGDTKNREEIIKRFKNNDFKVLYISYGCGSFSLNLQFCRNIIFADMDWDYARRIQAEGRIYRMDIDDDVHYYDVVCANSGLEDMILRCLHKKTNLLSEVKSEIEKIKGDKEKAKAFLKKL
jgi:SNF2 family DNA or RNA helicase